MKFEKQKLFKHTKAFAICGTTVLCAIFAFAHNDYTYSKLDVNEASVMETDGEEPSSIGDNQNIDIILKEKIEAIIEDKKNKDHEEYLKSLIVYDGLTMDELSEKLEKNFKIKGINMYGFVGDVPLGCLFDWDGFSLQATI